MSDLLDGLNFVIQYRRKDQTENYDPWHAMAAFDVQGPAEKYYEQQSSETWEYRLVEIEKFTETSARAALTTSQRADP